MSGLDTIPACHPLAARSHVNDSRNSERPIVCSEEITLLEATEMTHRLLTLYQLLGQPSRNDEGERASPSHPRSDSESP